MYPAKFDYLRALSVDEALNLSSQHGDAKFMAGGHSLIPMMKLRLAQPETLIDIGRISDLKGIRMENGQDGQGERIHVGALTTHAEIAASTLLHERCALVAEAAAEIGDVQVRNRGTIGGNIAHADPGSDLPATLVACGAQIALRSTGGSRSVAAKDFFVDLLTTDLAEGELIVAIHFPTFARGTGSAYLKFEHPASGYAVVGAAAWLRMEGGTCKAAGLALNGVTATPFDGNEAVQALVGTQASDDAIAATTKGLEFVDPMGDIYASGDYRSHVARVYARRALIQARDRAASS